MSPARNRFRLWARRSIHHPYSWKYNKREILGSLEYATEHLGVKLTSCSDINDVERYRLRLRGGVVHGNIGNLICGILPAITKSNNKKGDPVDNAGRENVRLNVENIKNKSHILEEMMGEEKVKTSGAYYDLDTGGVKFLNPL